MKPRRWRRGACGRDVGGGAVAGGGGGAGRAAQGGGLIDGLGGLEEAIARAKEAGGGSAKFADDPVLVRSRHYHSRPDPYEPDEDAKKDQSDERRGSLG